MNCYKSWCFVWCGKWCFTWEGAGRGDGRCRILHAIGSEQYFFVCNEKQHIFKLIAEPYYKFQRILCLLLEYTQPNFWKCNSCTKRENNFYSHYIIPKPKIRVNHMNKSMTFKKYSKCNNTLLRLVKKSILMS